MLLLLYAVKRGRTVAFDIIKLRPLFERVDYVENCGVYVSDSEYDGMPSETSCVGDLAVNWQFVFDCVRSPFPRLSLAFEKCSYSGAIPAGLFYGISVYYLVYDEVVVAVDSEHIA